MKRCFLGFAVVAALVVAGCGPEEGTPTKHTVTIEGDGIDLAQVQTIAASEADDAHIQVDVNATKGIDTFMVEITSSNAAFVDALAMLGLNVEFDLANPGPLAAVLSSSMVDLPNGAEVKGKKTVPFDISNFIPMIFVTLQGGSMTANFKLTVSDDEGNSDSKTLKLNLVDDMPVVSIVGDGFDITGTHVIEVADVASAEFVVEVTSTNPIDSFLVDISSSTHSGFDAILAAAGISGVFDIAEPGALAEMLSGLGIHNGAAVKGQTDVTLDISGFIPMLFQVVGADNSVSIEMTVSDADGTSDSKTLAISFGEAPVSEPSAQLPNGGFETYGNNDSGTGKIGYYFYSDLANGTDKFWDNGNAGTQILGTNVTTPDTDVRTGSSGTSSVKMKSQFAGVGSFGAFAAGNLYSGDFGETRTNPSNPSGTVHFGQPFTERPAALSVWYKATAGTVNYAKAGAPLANGDTDKYQIYIALVDGADYNPAAQGADGGSHWHTVDTANLAGTAINYATDERVIGYGSFESSQNVAEWTQKTIEIAYRSERTPTHIVVVASASMYGDYFTGSTSSVLWVDDMELLYSR